MKELYERTNHFDSVPLFESIMEALNNTVEQKQKFPALRINTQDEIELICSDSEDDKPSKKDSQTLIVDKAKIANETLIEFFKSPINCEKLKTHIKECGLPFNDTKAISFIKHEDTNLCVFTLPFSVSVLDSFMKQRSVGYSGYRYGNSLLSLNRTFTPKIGWIRLTPVALSYRDTYFIRSAGCQCVELPSLQLLARLPKFNNTAKNMHWCPSKVTKKLGIDPLNFERLLIAIFNHYNLTLNIENPFYPQSSDGSYEINPPDVRSQHEIRIVAMDPTSELFYAKFGNSTLEELQHCMSLEISVEAFLRQHIILLQAKCEDATQTAAAKKHIELAQQIIEQEQQRISTLEELTQEKTPSTHSEEVQSSKNHSKP